MRDWFYDLTMPGRLGIIVLAVMILWMSCRFLNWVIAFLSRIWLRVEFRMVRWLRQRSWDALIGALPGSLIYLLMRCSKGRVSIGSVVFVLGFVVGLTTLVANGGLLRETAQPDPDLESPVVVPFSPPREPENQVVTTERTAVPEKTVDEAIEGIKRRYDQWKIDHNNKDMTGMMNIITPDYLYYSKNEITPSGYAQALSYYKKKFNGTSDLNCNNISMSDFQRVGYNRFSADVAIDFTETDAYGRRSFIAIKQLERWRYDESDWRCYRIEVTLRRDSNDLRSFLGSDEGSIGEMTFILPKRWQFYREESFSGGESRIYGSIDDTDVKVVAGLNYNGDGFLERWESDINQVRQGDWTAEPTDDSSLGGKRARRLQYREKEDDRTHINRAVFFNGRGYYLLFLTPAKKNPRYATHFQALRESLVLEASSEASPE